MTIKKTAIALAFAAALSTGAHAATGANIIFTDNFNADATGLNATPAGWTIVDGSVDIIGKGSSFDLLPGYGHYVDLDGSTGQAGTLSMSFSGLADGEYTLEFALAGNQRVKGQEDVQVGFGGQDYVFSPAEMKGFQHHAVTGYAVNGTLTVTFHDLSNDNVGALLDHVKISTNVSAVPEPASAALLLAGLGAIGFAARRRKV